MDPNIPAKEQEEILAAVASGKKIHAIKLYREATGLGLAESKAVIDDLEARIPGPSIMPVVAASATVPGSTPPNSVPAAAVAPSSATAGCAALITVLTMIGLAVALFTVPTTDKELGRHVDAFSIAALMLITIQGCRLAANPRRKTLAFLVLGTAVLLMFAKIYAALML